MTCREYKDMMMAYLDSELDAQQQQVFQDHVKTCPACQTELEEFNQLKEITDSVALVEPEDHIWQQYWDNVYNRVERGVGWCLFSLAGICLIIYCGFRIIEEIVTDPTVGFLLKGSLLVLITGLAVLFVSVLRERLYFWKNDRYRKVRR
jgi:predicted anti-sigma-YlaC factor YlaD